jgi:hypothetical protein
MTHLLLHKTPNSVSSEPGAAHFAKFSQHGYGFKIWIHYKETQMKDSVRDLKPYVVDDEYELEFELLTTGQLTEAAERDLEVFAKQMSEFEDFPVSFQLVNTEVIATRLAEAESKELPTIMHQFTLSSGQYLQMDIKGTRSIIVPCR